MKHSISMTTCTVIALRNLISCLVYGVLCHVIVRYMMLKTVEIV